MYSNVGIVLYIVYNLSWIINIFVDGKCIYSMYN